ncbi:hypothetical protein ACFLRB_02795 [Acidobacteriota bacterium]
MPTSIPYDPSLELANVVPQARLDILKQISDLQAPVDAAEEDMNAALMTLRSLNMTLQEMVNLGIDTKDLEKSKEEAKKEVAEAAKKVVDARLAAYPKISPLRAKLGNITESIESPVDYNRTEIKRMPLSADSIKMDSQYFSFDEEVQSAENTMEAIKTFVSQSTDFWFESESTETTDAVQSQINKQRENHELQGTLIITASCTHQNAALLAPFVLDVDKAIRVWNDLFPDDMIKTNDPASITKIAAQQQTKEAKEFHILSGASYGSSFVGMVHVLKSEST